MRVLIRDFVMVILPLDSDIFLKDYLKACYKVTQTPLISRLSLMFCRIEFLWLHFSDEEEAACEAHILQETAMSPGEVFGASNHAWTPISLKHTNVSCNFCEGKIWLKAGSRCKKCHFVCHNKCVSKVDKQKECIKLSVVDDDGIFEVLDGSELKRDPLSSTSTGYPNPPSPSFTDDTVSTHSVFTDDGAGTSTRRRRIADKISNTFRGFRSSKGKEKSVSSETDESIAVPKIKTLLIKVNFLF